MSKLIFYTDTHLVPERLEALSIVYDKIGEIAVAENALLVNGGDTFDSRGSIPTACLDFLCRKFDDWKRKRLEQVILVGNHDQEDREGLVHAMSVFKNYGWHVVDKPIELDVAPHFAFFPYMKDVTEKICKTSAKYAVVHWGIRGAKRNDSNVDSDGVPIEWLRGYDKVFSGHYHYRNKFGNVQYIGTALQKDFAEMGQDKGVILFDTKTNKSEFIEIKGTPKHYEIIVDFSEGKTKITKPEGIKPRDKVRVKVIGDFEKCAQFQREHAIKVSGVESVTIEREPKEKHFSRLSIASNEVHNVEALMDKYTGFVDTTLDRKKLLALGKELFHEDV